MSRKSVRRAALGALLAVLLGVAAPAQVSAWSGNISNAGLVTRVWQWLQTLLPDPIRPACTENCGDAGYGVDPNG
jgi:hypothetical protein